MIEKLKNKVCLIITLSISTLLIGIIVVFAILNYNNTLNAITSMLDRFNNFPREINSGEEKINELDMYKIYSYMINGDKLEKNYIEDNEEIEKYAIKALNKKSEKGVVGNYIFKTKNLKDGKKMILLIEDENTANRIKMIYITSCIIIILAIIITYIIAKKISNLIVKPVEETIEKQKQFISDASHELKTPLAVIEANVGVLENEVGTSKWMNYIQNEISSMDKLINKLLFLAKVENRKDVSEKEIFNISEEVDIVCAMFESMTYEKNIKLESNIEKNIKFDGNKEDIKQVLSIIIENAITHTKNNGKTIVELKKEKNNIIIEIKNEGDPIPEEEYIKIFERFYMVDKSRNRKEKHYGLGLAIAKSIVEQYNGKITVRCDNGITNFKIIL